MYKALIACALVFPLTAGASQIVEHCPTATSIVESHGTYRAQARDPQYQWNAIPAPGNGGAVIRFDEAIFYPDDATASQGELARCSYKLERGMLDMTYQNIAGRPKSQLHDRRAWAREQGPFGIPYDACRRADGVECTFHTTPEI